MFNGPSAPASGTVRSGRPPPGYGVHSGRSPPATRRRSSAWSGMNVLTVSWTSGFEATVTPGGAVLQGYRSRRRSAPWNALRPRSGVPMPKMNTAMATAHTHRPATRSDGAAEDTPPSRRGLSRKPGPRGSSARQPQAEEHPQGPHAVNASDLLALLAAPGTVPDRDLVDALAPSQELPGDLRLDAEVVRVEVERPPQVGRVVLQVGVQHREEVTAGSLDSGSNRGPLARISTPAD